LAEVEPGKGMKLMRHGKKSRLSRRVVIIRDERKGRGMDDDLKIKMRGRKGRESVKRKRR
jgi:hypothetical protein